MKHQDYLRQFLKETTAQAVLNRNKADGGNRKFILVEMGDYADNITAERVKRVIDGYGQKKQAVEGTGGSFSYYELGEPLFKGQNLNKNIGIDHIREYIWYMETRQNYLCMKVPTGGGKTLLACNAIKPILDALPPMKAKVVVWLVPSDTILTQTIAALKNTEHPYRQKIDTDFEYKVEVYSKQELLSGQNFNMAAVSEQLSILVLSHDSFRGRKESLKAKQENSNLVFRDRSSVLMDLLTIILILL